MKARETEKGYTSIELFAGAGGLALGLEKAGLQNILLVENNKDCVATLKANRPEWNVLHTDVSTVDFSNMKADIVTGGFPCQAFSHAGKKLGFDDTRGTLFFEFARCIKEVEPKIFVGENVEGLVRHNEGKTFKTMLEILRSFEYDVKYQVLNAVNYNVPQKRKRLFIVGTRGGLKYYFPKPQKKIVTLREALKDVPSSLGQKYSKWREEILSKVPPGGSWVDLPIELQKVYMGKSFYSSGGRRGMARRISWDEPCLTLTTSPTQKETDRIHPLETRPFTIREYARIQTFPDGWVFKGSLQPQYKQIGNAVPVNLAEAIGTSLIDALAREAFQKQPQKTLEVFVRQPR
ncbi:MAG: DNA (cytosine-5-)-methyltransferase [Candidatus Thermoplasmatota archaeon]|nr:DNA (cytosine-5-)-methyltransferase [Candidatus Thermoplasmatota archaeon]